MASGMEWALNAVFNYLGIDPEAGKKQLADTSQIIVKAGETLDRIEALQQQILARLPTPEEVQNVDRSATDNGTQTRTLQANGAGLVIGSTGGGD